MSSSSSSITHQFSLLLFLLLTTISYSSSINNNEIQKGFYATPDSSSSIKFQPILTDPTSSFAFGFLRINSSLLDLAILHLPSSFPIWSALPARPASWAHTTSLSFNGSTLVLSDSRHSALSWSTPSPNNDNIVKDDYNLVLLNSSNLQIISRNQIIWQSFHYPSDTIVEHQNFTTKSILFSTNQRYSMNLGPTYLALYVQNLGMYWKRTALQAKAQIDLSQGPIYARLDPTGFLGLYQNETAIVDVISFDTFNAGIKKSLRRLTLESDGNLKAYYWSGSNWVSDFKTISQTCDLPAACGPYGLCHVEGQKCDGCVGNNEGCRFREESGDFCGSDANGFRVLRKAGVDLANKELLGFVEVESLEKCEGLCENNCSCWGILYNNASGYCYRIEYPIQTVLAASDERKVGYFKVRSLEGRNEGRKVAGVVLIIVGVLCFVCGVGFAGYRVWNARRRRSDEDEVGMIPYKDLRSNSCKSIEMSRLSFIK